MQRDLPIIQKTYDLVKWYVPILNKLPREHKFLLGDRIITGLYDLLEGLVLARYSSNKLPQLKALYYATVRLVGLTSAGSRVEPN